MRINLEIKFDRMLLIILGDNRVTSIELRLIESTMDSTERTLTAQVLIACSVIEIARQELIFVSRKYNEHYLIN